MASEKLYLVWGKNSKTGWNDMSQKEWLTSLEAEAEAIRLAEQLPNIEFYVLSALSKYVGTIKVQKYHIPTPESEAPHE